MNRLFTTRLAIAILLVLTCGLASAQSHSLERTYLDAGYFGSGLAIPATEWTAVGPVVDIVCPGTSGTCTINAIHSIQVRGTSKAGNEIQVDFMLDGELLELAQQVGEVPTNGSFEVFSATELTREVSLGSHTVQTAVYSLDGTSVYNYNTTYQIYKP